MVEIKPFNCGDLDKNIVRLEWEKWLRSLKLYFEADDITDSKKRRAKLLHLGGTQLQEVVYNLPGALDEPVGLTSAQENSYDPFQHLVDKLNDYFSPQRNSSFERNLFRELKPLENEEISKFLLRLRTQAARCDFGKTELESRELAIKDKLIGDWASSELKKRLLERELSLDEAIIMCTTHEQVNKQLFLANSQKSEEVSRVWNDKTANRFNIGNSVCFRCGNERHRANDKKCPAYASKCKTCGKIGHWAKMCRTTKGYNGKRAREDYGKVGNYSKRQKTAVKDHAYRVHKLSDEEESFCNNIISDKESETEDERIICLIGGTKIHLLIDSGCKYNLMSENDWKTLQSTKAIIFNQRENDGNSFRAYAADCPLKICSVFESPVKIENREERIETFYVVQNGRESLLGRDSAIKLKVLKLGINVNHINDVVPFPTINGIKVKLSIDEAVEPVRQPVRRVPVGYESEVEKKIKETLAQGIIEKVNGFSLWLSPVVIVTKDDGSIRICLDMRMANRAIQREAFPFPTVDEIFSKLRGAKYFSRLDLKQAYYQLELDESSRDITTFITHIGVFRYTRLVFGVNTAPEIFQREFQSLLASLSGCINYLDDVIVFGRDEREHDVNLKAVLDRFTERNVTLNEKKCSYKLKQLQFLGHIISDKGIEPDTTKVETIVKFREPETKEELRSFLGLVSYLGKFVPDLAATSAPLWKLTKLNENFEWGLVQKDAFEKLKKAIGNVSILSYFNLRAPTRLIVDASPFALGAVLLQFENDEVKVISFASRSLSDVETRYSQTEKEGLACVWAVERFFYYLAGIEFELQTDHKPLTFMFRPASRPPARIERWVLRLQAFKFQIVYRAGKENIADSLSRLCARTKNEARENDACVYNIVEGGVPKALTITELSIESETDEELKQVRLWILKNDWNNHKSPFYPFRFELSTLGNIVLRGDRLVIPTKLRQRVLELTHEGHPGESVMKRRLRSKVWWPLIDREAEKHVKRCESCLIVSRPDHPPPMQRHKFPEKPWTYLAIDLLGPIPGTEEEYLVVLVDYFSRFVELKFIKPITSQSIISFLDETFSRQGYPLFLRSDNGRQFISKLTREYCDFNNIELSTSPPMWPQANGLVENMNGQLNKRLKIAMANELDYKTEINKFILMYNVTPHGTTEVAPSELLYKRKIRDKIPGISDVKFDSEDNVARDMDMINKQKGKEREDSRRGAKESQINVGDWVFMKNTEMGNKLTPTFGSTKYKVISTTGNEALVGNEDKYFRRHLNHLKKIPNSSQTPIDISNDQSIVEFQEPEKGQYGEAEEDKQQAASSQSQHQQQDKVEPLRLKKKGGMWQPESKWQP